MRATPFLLLFLAGTVLMGQTPDPLLYPDVTRLPEWALQGKFRFSRLDGGPIQVKKAARARWGKNFTEQDFEVLGNLYTKYADRTADLLTQAHVNWVWITWAVGYSENDEEEQRKHAANMVRKLHEKGIKAAAYICAASIFWESMFRDTPRSVRWLAFDANGNPFRYSGGKDPLRFMADISNPEWVDFVKRLVGSAIDAGADSIFFDNTAADAWNGPDKLKPFFEQIRRYSHGERQSNLVFFTNYGVSPAGLPLHTNMEVQYNEGWREPGAWGEEWNVSNIRRMKLVRGVIGEAKPMMSEYSIFHSGSRNTTWLAPRSQKLGIAEAAAFRSAFCWDQEGPFGTALVHNDPGAMASWQAIGEYNGFLKANERLFGSGRSLSSLAVLMSPKARRGRPPSFNWAEEPTGLFDLLSRNSVLYDIRLLGTFGEQQLRAYPAVVLPASVELTSDQLAMLRRYKAGGGKIYVLGSAEERSELAAVSSPDAVFDNLAKSKPAQDEVIKKIRSLTSRGNWISVEGAPHVVATVTRVDGQKGFAVHLLNYSPEVASNLRLRLNFGADSGLTGGERPQLLTPDKNTRGLAQFTRRGSLIEFTLSSLDIYGVAHLK